MVAVVAGMYFYARWRVSRAVHQVPAPIGLDIQQTAEGFSISKSEQGRTLFTVSASKAVQFKEGGVAALHNVKIVVYGKDASRFDRIVGDDFEYDPKSGDITAKDKVLMELEANPEGLKHSDQTPPTKSRNPMHLETEGLVFNKNTGDASAKGKVRFATAEASGSAVGVGYVSKTGTMTLRSAVEMTFTRPQPFRLTADHGVITKTPREVVLNAAHLTRDQQHMWSEQATFFLRDDDTVERIVAEGDVEGEFPGNSSAHARADRAEMLLTGSRNLLTLATLTGGVQLSTQGAQPAEADAGRVILHFAGEQVLKSVHAEDGVRLTQKRQNVVNAGPGSVSQASAGEQDVEMTAPTMDVAVKDGRQVELAETTGPPEIVITQPSTQQKTVVTARRFTAKFTEKNRLSLLHGEPDAKIVSSTRGEPDRVSTSPTLDVAFQPDGGISTITQAGGLAYVSGTQKAWAQRGTYTAADGMLVLSGFPRVVDGGMTTTAKTIRFNRINGDAIADGDVKSTYLDLHRSEPKADSHPITPSAGVMGAPGSLGAPAQPDEGMLASSDPIHVASRSMTAHHASATAVYTGDARLWQNGNLVEAPTLEFDREHRLLEAESTAAQAVKTVFVQVDKSGKVTPIIITSPYLTYHDAERKAFLNGGVTATGSDTTITSRQMTVYLVARGKFAGGGTGGTSPVFGSPSSAGQVEKIVAEKDVVVTEPTRRGIGDRLVYTAADDRFELTGGPPSIFDAERGKITGDSLTFFKRDDRVLVEGRETSPAVTRTQVAR